MRPNRCIMRIPSHCITFPFPSLRGGLRPYVWDQIVLRLIQLESWGGARVEDFRADYKPIELLMFQQGGEDTLMPSFPNVKVVTTTTTLYFFNTTSNLVELESWGCFYNADYKARIFHEVSKKGEISY